VGLISSGVAKGVNIMGRMIFKTPATITVFSTIFIINTNNENNFRGKY